MGGGDHGHHKTIKVPDWKIYKVENSPELMEVKQALAQKGLSDPWLRNEVWRYDRKQFPTPTTNTKILLFRGFKYGLALAVATVVGEKLWDSAFPGEHGHHDHH